MSVICDTGVYCIYNYVTRKRYIGSAAKSISKRWGGHRYYLNKGLHPNQHLQASWKKYGSVSFRFYVVEECAPELCIQSEQYWIDYYSACDRKLGYNKSPTAGSPLGFIHTKETRLKVSKALKGRKKTKEHAQNIKAGKQNISLETKAKMSAYSRSRTKSHREKLRVAMLGNKNGAVKCTEEKRKKISDAIKLRWKIWREAGMIEEIGKKISEGRKKAAIT